VYPAVYAASSPDKPAVIMGGSGATMTYRELDERSNRLAQLLRAAGLRRGDHVALFMENHLRYLEVTWAALRSGLYLTAINSYLTPSEVEYIVEDCGATAFITSTAKAGVAAQVAMPSRVSVRLSVGGAEGFDDYETALAAHPPTPIDDESMGTFMLYSSGTTGRPKGVKRPLGDVHPRDPDPTVAGLQVLYKFRESMVYLSPAPMYHAAPLAYSMWATRCGGTVVIMERFDPEHVLQLVERHRITHAQFVPTMFIRMLKLDEETRSRHDVSSLEVAIHAAAPCPVPVKQQMIEWWGPKLYEYYAGTEGNGSTFITSEEWLRKPGSVGRASGTTVIHILDEDGNPQPAGSEGTVWFSGGGVFEYHNAPEKTAESHRPGGLSTLGDVGYLDEDGYLFLTDRKAYMIIAGGVNIYPREIEDVLVTHPAVADVAVFGVPNDDLGEEVKAVVQPIDMDEAGPALAAELTTWCAERLARFKVPRSIDFEPELPRLPTGKLYKRLLRDRYLGKAPGTIV
jgi:acyl-CoA synthetase (AMP-forming)/AMP-acid ligase II